MRFLLLSLVNFFSMNSQAAEVLCAGKWENMHYASLFGAVRYSITCNDQSPIRSFDKLKCYTESCRENFLENVRNRLSSDSAGLFRIAKGVAGDFDIYSNAPQKYKDKAPLYFIRRQVHLWKKFNSSVVKESLGVFGNGLSAQYFSDSLISLVDLSHVNSVIDQLNLSLLDKVAFKVNNSNSLVELWVLRKN